MPTEIVNCEFCGRDTPNKCRLCKHCLASQATKEHRATDDEDEWRSLPLKQRQAAVECWRHQGYFQEDERSEVDDEVERTMREMLE